MTMRVEIHSKRGFETLEGQPRYTAFQVAQIVESLLTEGAQATVSVLHVDKSKCQDGCDGDWTPDELIPARKATKRRPGADEHIVCAVCGLPR